MVHKGMVRMMARRYGAIRSALKWQGVQRTEVMEIPAKPAVPAGLALAILLAGVLLAAGCTQATGSVQVVTDPPGAEVLVDGIPNGTAPVLVANLPAGDYTFEARKDWYIDAGQRVSVTGGNMTITIPMQTITKPTRTCNAMLTDLGTGTTRRILYIGDVSVSRQKIRFRIGRTMTDTADRFQLEGADIVIADKKEIIQLKPDTPLFLKDTDPQPGTWRITGAVNNKNEIELSRNAQFTIAGTFPSGRTVSASGPVSIEVRPRIGAAAAASCEVTSS